MSMNQGDSGFSSIEAVLPLGPVRRIERKGKKRSPTLGSWREIFMEKLAGVDLAGLFSVDDVPGNSKGEEQRTEQAFVIRNTGGASIVVETEEDFQNVLIMIQRFADDPERLIESHLNLFIEPAPPGKVLNSAG